MHDSSAIIYLQNTNIIHITRTCDCEHKMVLDVQIGQRRCRSRSCRKDKCIKTNNWLQMSKVKLQTIVHYIYGWYHDQI